MANLIPLNKLSVGETAIIDRLENIETKKRKRLNEMGFFCGAKIVVLKKLRSVLIVGIRGFALCLDRETAENIWVMGGAECKK